MNELKIMSDTLTMSSREIAELTGKEHKNVLRDINNISEELGQLIFEQSSYINSQNKEQPEYLLNKENTLLLVSGYSVSLRQAIIRRWQELENQQAPKLPTTYKEALVALLEQVEVNEQQQRVIQQKSNTINRLIHTNKTYNTTEIAKELGFKSAIALNKELEERGIQYKTNGTYVMYAKYADLGYTEVKQHIKDSGTILYYTRWTGKGRDFLMDLFKQGE